MNSDLRKFAEDWLQTHLAQCTKEQQHVFRRMYSHTDLARPLDLVVKEMPDDKIDWAMQQVKRSLENNQKRELAS